MVLLLTEENSVLEVASQITFLGLIAYKPIAYKNKIVY